MSGAISESARELAVQLARRLAQDAELTQRLRDAQQRLAQANDRLWWGLHPDGLARSTESTPRRSTSRSQRTAPRYSAPPTRSQPTQQVHWSIHRAFIDYQTAAEERRQLAADTGESIREFVDELVAAGWTEQQARNADVHQLAHARRRSPPGPPPRNPAVVTRSDAIPAPCDSAPLVCAERAVLAARPPRARPMRPTGASHAEDRRAVLTSLGQLRLVAVMFALARCGSTGTAREPRGLSHAADLLRR